MVEIIMDALMGIKSNIEIEWNKIHRDKKAKDLVNRYEEKIYSFEYDKRVMILESFDKCCVLDKIII